MLGRTYTDRASLTAKVREPKQTGERRAKMAQMGDFAR